ncbi:MAG: hypothetical protein ACSHW0_01405 [Thalassotalea sp.]
MSHQLSFASIKLLADDIAEVVVDNNIEITLEMVEELEAFLNHNFKQAFGLLVNKVNPYSYSFEAMTCMASNKYLAALAVVNYEDHSEDPIHYVLKIRAVDELNIKVFSGLELGWQQAKDWLAHELENIKS